MAAQETVLTAEQLLAELPVNAVEAREIAAAIAESWTLRVQIASEESSND